MSQRRAKGAGREGVVVVVSGRERGRRKKGRLSQRREMRMERPARASV